MNLSFPVLLAAMVLVSAIKPAAADAASAFDAANRLYADGKFSEAAAAYEKIIESGQVSPALYFNCGNAEFKAGHPGRAIAAYRRAEQLSPRDSEIHANLDFVRNQIPDAPARVNRWTDWLNHLTLDEWTLLAAIALWLTFALLAAAQIRPRLKPKLRGLTRLAILAAILLCASCAIAVANHVSKTTVVVVATEATARSGPFDDAQSVFTAHDGAEFNVVSRHDDWFQVAADSNRIGWLPRQQVDVLPGG